MENERHFSRFRLDLANEQLWAGDLELKLRRKTFEVLRYLIGRPGQLVTKEALLDEVWGQVAVSDSMPSICVAELRKALGDDPRSPTVIETVHGRGYRFIAQLRVARLPLRESAPPVPAPLMVGREEELARLREYFAQASQGARRIVFITGEPGIGKTTFAESFLAMLTRDGIARVARGQCVEQYGAGEPYMPVLEALTRLCQDIDGTRSIETLRRVAPSWLPQMPSLLSRDDRERLQPAIRTVTQQRILREMTSALEELSSELPLVLLLEDLQWSDYSTLELIAAVARRTEPARLMIIGTYRPVEMLVRDHPLRATKEELELHAYCHELRLKLLDEKDVGAYLTLRFTEIKDRSFEEIASIVHARTEGNPLFIVNVIDYLVEQGFLTDPLKIETPRNIRQMIERNFEGLDPDEQAVLRTASAAGIEFSAAAVAAALERSVSEIEDYCSKLSRNEQFLRAEGVSEWPDGTIAATFRFRHGLYREVLYGQIAAGQRAKMHRRLAERQERAYGAHAPEIAAELAQHYARAHDRDKAIHYFRLAGERAIARGAAIEAHEHYNRALANLLELPAGLERDHREFALQVELGMALRGAKNWTGSEAFRTMSRAMQLGEMLGRTQKLPEVLFALAAISLSQGQAKASQQFGERMLRLAQVEADPGLIAAARYRIGTAKLLGGKLAESRDLLNVAAHGPADGCALARDAHIHSRAMGALAVVRLGLPDRARQLLSEAFELSRRHGNLYNEGFVHMSAILMHDALREAQKVLEHADALSGIADDNPAYSTFADGSAGTALFTLGEHEEGSARMRRALASGEFGLDEAARRVLEAQLCAIDGRTQDGLAASEAGLRVAPELQFYKPQLLRLRANFLAQIGGAEERSESAFMEAIECARGQDNKLDELESALCFARWLAAQNRPSEAQECITKIYHSFDEGFDIHALGEARLLIEEIGKKVRRARLSNQFSPG